MIESGGTIVHSRGIVLEADAAFLPFPTLFGVLDLPSGGIVLVSCLVSEFTPGDAAGPFPPHGLFGRLDWLMPTRSGRRKARRTDFMASSTQRVMHSSRVVDQRRPDLIE